jgi:hypothetical protein
MRKVFSRGLHKQNIAQPSFGRFAMDFFGDFFEGTTIRVDANEELTGVFTRTVVDKATVSGTNIYNYSSVVRSNEFLKSSAIELSGGSPAN